MVPMSASDQHRKLRKSWNEPGHAHELTFSCFHRLPLLNHDRTRQWLIDALNRSRKRWEFDLWAYVIMPEHVHFLIHPHREHYKISDILKSIKQPVARNALRYLREIKSNGLSRLAVVRSGGVEYRFWQEGGGYDRNIIKEYTAWKSIEYIHNNPVKRGLVNHAVEWKWSSAELSTDVPSHSPTAPSTRRVTRRRR